MRDTKSNFVVLGEDEFESLCEVLKKVPILSFHDILGIESVCGVLSKESIISKFDKTIDLYHIVLDDISDAVVFGGHNWVMVVLHQDEDGIGVKHLDVRSIEESIGISSNHILIKKDLLPVHIISGINKLQSGIDRYFWVRGFYKNSKDTKLS